MILWLPYFPNSPSATPQPLTDEGMKALSEVVLATIEDDTKRNATIEGCSIETKRRVSSLDEEPICDVALIKDGRSINMNVHRPRGNFLVFFEARPERPPTELIN